MVNIALIGAGTWGATHAAIYREHPSANCVAVCDLNLSRAASVAEKFGIPKYFASAEEMLNNCVCDAVAIVTPDFLHARLAEMCARMGKHMLIEKPIATTAVDTARIISVSGQHNVRVMVDLHNRFSPPFAEAKSTIASGQFGAVQHGYFRLNDAKWVATDMLAWTADSSILWFLGSHSLDTLRWLFDDEIARVYAVSRRGVLDKLGVNAPDTYLTTIEFRRGGIAQMENSWIAPNGNPNTNDIKCSIVCEHGALAIDATHHNLLQVFSETTARVPDILVTNTVHDRVKGFAYESIRDFVDCIETGREFIVSMEDAANTTLAILAIMESAKTGLPVDVKTIDEV